MSYSQSIARPPQKRFNSPQPGTIDPNAPPATGKSTLSGVVINAKTHEPIKKANVMINGAASLSAVTDAGGNFSFRALPAGAYWVMANQPDFTARAQRGQMALNASLSDGEEKTGVEIALQPGASISGKVSDDDNRPVERCSVNASRADTKSSRPGLAGSVGDSTDSDGNYRIHGITAGRYVVRVQCRQSFPAAHGFMRLNDPDIPMEGYGPVTYAGGGSPGSGGLLLESGAELGGIDFHVERSRMFSVRATVVGVDASLLPTVQVFMTPKDNAQDDDVGMPARYIGRRGFYMFRNVAPGSYGVTAIVVHGDKAYEARQDIQVGNTQNTDVQLTMTAGPNISGVVVSDDPNIQLEGQQISLQPLQQNYRGQFPTTTLAKDGTFEFKAILPGHFSMAGLQGGFFKSVTLSGREVTPFDFEIAGESAGVLHISLSSRFGKVQVSAESQPAPAEQMAAALLPVGGGQPLVNFFSGSGPVNVEFSAVPPGKYRVLLLASDNPWNVANDPGAQKILEDRMSQITVAEASEQRITATVVGRDELNTLFDSTE